MSAVPRVSSIVVTSKPSIAACSALIGSISVTITRAPNAAQRMRRAFADVAVAANTRDLAGDHHVGRALDAVRQRFAAAVELSNFDLVTESFTLIAGTQQLALLEHLVEAMHAGGRLLGNTSPILHDRASGAVLRDPLEQILDDLLLVAIRTACSPSRYPLRVRSLCG